ncbi:MULTISPECIES: hypothetical protein [unclassified Paenibacillus]|uniref:hypothetical protein n=1 Tax=unclassified Paenibacillus TaxID=185978 RepID=UPI0009A66637|nr:MULTISPECIES: hypothetical protein [unclassified Paenibacillus]
MNRLLKFLRDYAEDYLLFLGVLIINLATYRINVTAGLYCTGLSSIILAVLVMRVSRLPPKGR